MFKHSLSIVIASAVLAATGPSILAAPPKPATKVFPASCDVVWTAAKAVVASHYKAITMAEHDHLGTFEIGNDILTKRRSLSFTLTDEGAGCNVGITGHFSGLMNNDKGDFFKRLEAELGPAK